MSSIELVVRVPEDKYKWIKEHKGCTDFQITEMLYNRVRNGTPLKKGHKGLIEDDSEVGPVFDVEQSRVGHKYVTQEDLKTLAIIEADEESEE